MRKIAIILIVLMAAVLLTPGVAKAVPIFNPSNGHYYEIVSYSLFSDRRWTSAKTTAEGMSYDGVQGHLVTITSADENQWLVDHLDSYVEYWLGASDQDEEGNWQWVTGETWDYTNWADGEPNDQWPGEDYLTFWNGAGEWNDWGNWGDPFSNWPEGFIVEYDLDLPGGETIPEPFTMALFGTGLLGLIGLNRRKK